MPIFGNLRVEIEKYEQGKVKEHQTQTLQACLSSFYQREKLKSGREAKQVSMLGNVSRRHRGTELKTYYLVSLEKQGWSQCVTTKWNPWYKEALHYHKCLFWFFFVLSGIVHDSKLVGDTLIKGGY